MCALILYFVYYRKEKIRLRTLLVFVPLVFMIAWDQIEYYFITLQNGSARAQLLIKAFDVAGDHFPLGAGFATYGSHYSAVVYSPLYGIYNLSGVHGLVENKASFVSDSFWPMILGQTGWFGLILYCLALWAIYKKIQKIYRMDKALYTSALFSLVYLIIESTAASAFVHPTAIPFAMWLGFALSITNQKQNREIIKDLKVQIYQ